MTKFILPRTVMIYGKPYKVLRDKTSSTGASCCVCEHWIKVGTKSKNSQRIFDLFMHEVMEATLIELLLLYSYGDDGDHASQLFVMSHAKFQIFAAFVATSLFPLVTLKRAKSV